MSWSPVVNSIAKGMLVLAVDDFYFVSDILFHSRGTFGIHGLEQTEQELYHIEPLTLSKEVIGKILFIPWKMADCLSTSLNLHVIMQQ